jgi:hypothetical protein
VELITLLLLACGPSDNALSPTPRSPDAGDESGDAGDPDPADEQGDDSDDPLSDEEPSGDDGVDAEEPEPLDPVRLLIRASLDLRGVRPTVEEIERVEADPAEIDALIDEFLYDERFGERVVALFSEVYQTQTDTIPVSYEATDYAALAQSIGDEPLQLLAYIAVNDLPYYTVVTADFTMANEHLAEVWPVDYPEGETGWQPVSYTDGRPMSGILSSNAMWWRYQSSYANANRGRANAISRILLCNDYLSRPVEFDRNVDLLDEGAINEALQTNAGCISCHATLDPLASYLWGFFYNAPTSAVDATYYHPEREYWWQNTSGVAPGYYGEPSYTLEDLGQQIAADSRLPECAVETVFEQLIQRESALEDTQAMVDLREIFLGDDLNLRSLIRAVMARPEYRTEGEGAAGYKLTRPDMLASTIEALTGYRFTYADYDMLNTDTYGLRTLAGGVDGGFVTAPAEDVNATMSLVYERVAQAAAWYAVQHDKAYPSEATTFTHIGFTETPDTNREAMAAQIQDLHLRLFGHRVDADGPEVEANLDLWSALYDAEADPAAAWAGVLSVLLRDPEFLFY